MAALDVNGAMTNLKTMLSGLSAWQTICGVSTAAEAALRIHKYGVDVPEGQTMAPCMLLDIMQPSLNREGGQFQGLITVHITMELAIPGEYLTSYETEGEWFWGQWSAVLAGINDSVGDGGELMADGSLTWPVLPGRIDKDENNGRIEWNTTIGLDLYLR